MTIHAGPGTSWPYLGRACPFCCNKHSVEWITLPGVRESDYKLVGAVQCMECHHCWVEVFDIYTYGEVDANGNAIQSPNANVL